MTRPKPEKPDIREHGSPRDGQPQAMDRRLFVQLQAFGDCHDTAPLIDALREAEITGVLYEDVQDPRGVALVTAAEDPAVFLDVIRPMLNRAPFASLTHKPEFAMFGRTYAIGYEPDLQEALFDRPTRTILNPQWPWAVWYPLRRKGEFEQLSAEVRRGVLMEHGTIGRAFGEADLAHDVRLVSTGLDTHDNDFVIGLTGSQLHPLSAIVQRMRSTQQTSLYLEKLGPFFVGRVCWQSAVAPDA